MKIAVASSILYHIPFYDTLDIISKAGFQYIELDMYWKGGNWEMAQHLKGMSPDEVLELVSGTGLEIVSIHDTGGVIEENTRSAIDPSLYEYLDKIQKSPECLVFHPPHTKTSDGKKWWESFRPSYVDELTKLNPEYTVCIENFPYFEEYYIPLMNPEEILEFIETDSLFVNFDTTHFAQTDIDILDALDTLGNRVKSVHLSDYINDESHVFPGEGELDLAGFIRKLIDFDVRVLTLEYTLDKSGQMSKKQLIDRLKAARDFVVSALNTSD